MNKSDVDRMHCQETAWPADYKQQKEVKNETMFMHTDICPHVCDRQALGPSNIQSDKIEGVTQRYVSELKCANRSCVWKRASISMLWVQMPNSTDVGKKLVFVCVAQIHSYTYTHTRTKYMNQYICPSQHLHECLHIHTHVRMHVHVQIYVHIRTCVCTSSKCAYSTFTPMHVFTCTIYVGTIRTNSNWFMWIDVRISICMIMHAITTIYTQPKKYNRAMQVHHHTYAQYTFNDVQK